MLAGKYKRRSVDLQRYRVARFNPYLYHSVPDCGCGATAVALLTGMDPVHLTTLNGKKKGYPDRWMVKTLKAKGYTVIPIKWKEINSDRWITYPVSKFHVVLVSQIMSKREASWFVYHNGLCYHNFAAFAPETLDFLNKPSITAYCIWHPHWGVTIDM